VSALGGGSARVARRGGPGCPPRRGRTEGKVEHVVGDPLVRLPAVAQVRRQRALPRAVVAQRDAPTRLSARVGDRFHRAHRVLRVALLPPLPEQRPLGPRALVRAKHLTEQPLVARRRLRVPLGRGARGCPPDGALGVGGHHAAGGPLAEHHVRRVPVVVRLLVVPLGDTLRGLEGEGRRHGRGHHERPVVPRLDRARPVRLEQLLGKVWVPARVHVHGTKHHVPVAVQPVDVVRHVHELEARDVAHEAGGHGGEVAPGRQHA